MGIRHAGPRRGGGTRRTPPSHRPGLRNPKLVLSGFGKKLQSTLGSVFARITRALQARSLFLRQDPVFQKIFGMGDEGPTPQIFLAVLGPSHWIGLGRLLDLGRLSVPRGPLAACRALSPFLPLPVQDLVSLKTLPSPRSAKRPGLSPPPQWQ